MKPFIVCRPKNENIFEAVKWEGDNLHEIQEFFGTYPWKYEQNLYINDFEHGWELIPLGHYLFRYKDTNEYLHCAKDLSGVVLV